MSETSEIVQLCFGRELGMRTMADALKKLHDFGSLGDGRAEIKTRSLHLPSGEVTSLIVVLGPANKANIRWAIGMPSCTEFWGTATLGMRAKHDSVRLTDAIVDARGNVDLVDGTFLHAIEFIPIEMTADLTPVGRRIVHLAVRHFSRARRSYRYIDKALLPGAIGLNYCRLRDLSKVSLKEIEYRLRKAGCKASRQTIATALSNAGMRPTALLSRSKPRTAA